MPFQNTNGTIKAVIIADQTLTFAAKAPNTTTASQITAYTLTNTLSQKKAGRRDGCTFLLGQNILFHQISIM